MGVVSHFPLDKWNDHTQVEFIVGGTHALPVTAVSCVTTIATGEIVLAKPVRGFDVPGGHLEEGEDEITALIREVSEEVGAEFIQPPELVGHFVARQQPHLSQQYPEAAKIPLYIGRVNLDEVFMPILESSERRIATFEEALRLYHRPNPQFEAIMYYIRVKFPQYFAALSGGQSSLA